MINKDQIPDIANASFSGGPKLSKVGMSGIDLPVGFTSNGTTRSILAKADAYVSLVNTQARGIHMSRLFLALNKHLEEKALSISTIKETLTDFMESHASLSDAAYLTLHFELPVKRTALLSDNSGWRSYTVKVESTLDHTGLGVCLEFKIVYSSTCPCSAALARQVIQQSFETRFAGLSTVSTADAIEWLGTEKGINATPHGQRSIATIRLQLNTATSLPATSAWLDYIDLAENALGTPVQAPVKREDEQEFARLNAGNLMFAEDAARKLKNAFATLREISDFQICVEHLESLHPHDAVAFAIKDK